MELDASWDEHLTCKEFACKDAASFFWISPVS